MNVLNEVKKRPVASGVTLVGAAGAVILFMNVMPAMELIVRIKKAPDIADAAMQKATESREWIDAYIEQQKQQQALEAQRYELERQFNQQLLEMQRQQQQATQQWTPPYVPVLPQPMWREYDVTDETTWCCDLPTRQACFDEGQWRRCE